jgi:hypothetical protein
MNALIEKVLRPYGSKSHEMQVGKMVNGEFQVERGIWNVTKDNRLIVKRAYEGRGAQQEVTFKVSVPENYPLVIVLKEKYNHQLTTPDYRYEVLYSPEVAKPAVKKPRAKKVASPAVAAMQLPEGKKARLVRGKLVIK